MSRSLKMLGLALTMALVLGALTSSVSAASTPPQFTTTDGATIAAGQKTEHKFTVTGQSVTCVSAAFDGTASAATAETMSLEAKYENCKMEPLGATATITGFGKVGEANRCWYVLKADGGFDLECNGSGEVTITASTCVVHIGKQSLGSGMTYTNGNSGGKDDLTVKFNLTTLKANHTDGAGCPFSSGGVSEVDVYEGESTVTTTTGESVVNNSWDEEETGGLFTTTSGATVSAGQKTEHKMTITGQTVTCNVASFDGAAPSASFEEIAVAPTYSGCKSEPLGASMTITGYGNVGEANKCWYVWEADGGWRLECNGTGEVTTTVLSCTVHIQKQSLGSVLTFTNGTSGGKSDVTMAFTISGIKANHTDGFLCPFGSSGESEAGVLEGESTITATAGGNTVNLSHDT